MNIAVSVDFMSDMLPANEILQHHDSSPSLAPMQLRVPDDVYNTSCKPAVTCSHL